MSTQYTDTQKAFIRQWRIFSSDKASRRQLNASAHLLRCLALGKPVEKQFTQVTNLVKLANGRKPYDAVFQAVPLLQTLLLVISGEIGRSPQMQAFYREGWPGFCSLLETLSSEERFSIREQLKSLRENERLP